MPMYACTWADGDITFVFARTRQSALKQIEKQYVMDESFVIVPVDKFMATFNLDETGGVSDGSIGDTTLDEIIDKVCPEVGRAMDAAVEDFGADDGPEGQAMVSKAVEECRARIRRGELPAAKPIAPATNGR
jgi:hypothetical protein